MRKGLLIGSMILGLSVGAVRSVVAAPVGIGSGVIYLLSEGKFLRAGTNAFGQLGNGQAGQYITSGVTSSVLDVADPAVAIAAGMFHACFVTAKGVVKCWGSNDKGQAGQDPTTVPMVLQPTVVPLPAPAVDISASDSGTCIVDGTGKVMCWGGNHNGELGVQTPQKISFTPVVVPGVLNVKRVFAGQTGHTCALTTYGQVACWGSEISGQSGTGQCINKSGCQPVTVPLAGSAKELAVGPNHFCALLQSGVVQCWGDGSHGELGLGYNVTFAKTPTTVPGLIGVAGISAGTTHVCALTLPAGKVWCWGGSQGSVPSPGISAWSPTKMVLDMDGLTFTQVVAGYYNTCAIGGTYNELYCWGDASFGQLKPNTQSYTQKGIKWYTDDKGTLWWEGNLICANNQYFDAATKKCATKPIPCPSGMGYNPFQKLCVPVATPTGDCLHEWYYAKSEKEVYGPYHDCDSVPDAIDNNSELWCATLGVFVVGPKYGTAFVYCKDDSPCVKDPWLFAAGGVSAGPFKGCQNPTHDPKGSFCPTKIAYVTQHGFGTQYKSCGTSLSAQINFKTKGVLGTNQHSVSQTAINPKIMELFLPTPGMNKMYQYMPLFMNTYFNKDYSVKTVTPLDFKSFKTQGTKHVYEYKTDTATYHAVCDGKGLAKCPHPMSQKPPRTMKFNGVDRWMTIPGLTQGLPFSVGGWFCPTGSSQKNVAFFGKNSNVGGNEFLLGNWDDHFRVSYGDKVWNLQDTALSGCHHVVANVGKVGSGQVKVEVIMDGGAKIYTNFADKPLPAGGREWALGQEWDGDTASDFFQGYVSDVFVVPSLLALDQIKKLYDGSMSFAEKKFSGGQYLELPEAVTGSFFEWSFWVNPEKTSDQSFLGKHNNLGDNQFLIGFWYGQLRVALGDKGINLAPAFTGWHKLNIQIWIVAPKKTQLKVFMDGKLLYSGIVEHGDIDLVGGRPWVVGQEWDGDTPSDFFTGTIMGLELKRHADLDGMSAPDAIAASYQQDQFSQDVFYKPTASGNEYWAKEGDALISQVKLIIQNSKDIIAARLAVQVDRSVAFDNSYAAVFEDCSKKLAQAPKDKVAEWMVKNCKIASSSKQATSKLANNLEQLQKLTSDRMSIFESISKQYRDLLATEQKSAQKIVDPAVAQVLSRTTSAYFVALLSMLSEYDLSNDTCADPILNNDLIDGMLDLDTPPNANPTAISNWANMVGCQNLISLSYMDKLIQQAYLGTLAIIEKYLGQSQGLHDSYPDAINVRLLRNLSPYLLVLFDADKQDASVPSRKLLEEYATVLRKVAAGEIVSSKMGLSSDATVGTGLYPSVLLVQNTTTKAYDPQLLCNSITSLPLNGPTLPEDKSTFGDTAPLTDLWLINQWKTLSCDTPTKWDVAVTVEGVSCLDLPNLIDVATNRITMGDGSCKLWDSVLKNQSCCPAFLVEPPD